MCIESSINFSNRPSKVDLRNHVEEGREWSLAAVQRTQVLLRLCGSDDVNERMVSTMLATEVGRLLSLEDDGLAASEAVLSSLAIVASCLHQGIIFGFLTDTHRQGGPSVVATVLYILWWL